MAVIGAVQAIFTSDTTQWSRGCSQAVADIKNVDKESENVFRNLKKNFGRRSEIGEAFELLKGAGAVAGVAMATKDMAELTKKAVELKNQLNEGKLSGADMFRQLAEGVPIFGSLVSAGMNLVEFSTGEEAKRKEINARMEEGKKLSAELVKSGEAMKKVLTAAGDEMLRIQREIAKINATPLEQKKIENQQKQEDATASIKEKKAAALAAYDEEAKAMKKNSFAGQALAEMNERIADQQKRITNANPNSEWGKATIADANEKIAAVRAHAVEVEATWKREEKSRHEGRMDLAKKFDDMEAAEREKAIAAGAHEDGEHLAAVTKAQHEEHQKLLDAQAKGEIAAKRMAGDEVGAAAKEIQMRVADEQARNLQEAHAKMKELSIKEESEQGKAMIAAVNQRNNALSDAGRAEIAEKAKQFAERRKAEHDAIMGAGGNEVERVQAEEAKLKAERDKGIISAEEYEQKKSELEKKLREDLGAGTEESPYARYQKEVEKYGAALRAKIIDVDVFKSHVADAQAELRKQTTPEFKAAEQQVRRFNFSRLSTPGMANPNKDLIDVQKDQSKIQAGIKMAIDATNSILKNALKVDAISLAGA